ncbi:MAG: hypothetical protein DI626_03535 [Micavibrio aeruginosavorus]|uniref:Uncharacterized protein n=1 Tax=Micavibrio aeruginosavorus TaxID=349221 RepID=A0A2W5A2T4_9BACT|nr:MAG: hypothetical protein DI626_03535 [Micavibrio aeruginosavorus]
MRFAFALMAAVFIPLPSMAQGGASGFFYKDKPIDPVCVQKLLGLGDSEADFTPLTKCPLPDGVAEPDKRFKADEDGFYGFETTEEDSAITAYFMYRAAGRLKNGDYLIETIESGGGSGTFTSVSAIAYDGTSIKLTKKYAGGDRCNGGITHAAVEGGKAVYRYSATPAELAQIFLGAGEYAPYEDLESSAASCAGEVEERDGVITALVLDREQWAEGADDASLSGDYAYQGCFNNYMSSYLKVPAHSETLSRDEAVAFFKKFDATCKKS